MRISDWSSDVCSSDLRGVLVLDHAGDGAERTVGDVPRDRAPELPRRDAPRLAIGTGRDDRHIGVAEGGVEVIAEGVELTDHLARQMRLGDGARAQQDRKSAVEGKSVSVRVDLGGRRIITNTKTNKNKSKKYNK